MPLSINLPSDGTLVTQERKWTSAMWAWMRDLTASFNSGGGFAPADATYHLRTADTDLPNGRVATDSATVTLDYATPGQVKWAAVNTGTVTHTAGALTLNELVLGNGGADIKTVAATDGQVPIGKSSDGTVTFATLTAGTNISITNGAATITISATPGSSRQFWAYRANTGATSGYPGDGYLLWNNATQISATALEFSHLTFDSIDIDIFLAFLAVGDTIVVQDEDASANFQEWTITSAPTNTNPGAANSYWTVPVSLSDSGGTGTTGFANNHRLIAAIFSIGSVTADYVVMSDGANPPTPMDDGAGNFLYVGYTP